MSIIWGFLSLKGGYTGLSESTLIKMPHCWKSHVTAQLRFSASVKLWMVIVFDIVFEHTLFFGNLKLTLISSPEPLWLLDVSGLSSTTSPPKLLAGFLPNLAGMILIWPSLIIVQMVLVRCISRSHRQKIDFRDENFLSETTRHRALIFGM